MIMYTKATKLNILGNLATLSEYAINRQDAIIQTYAGLAANECIKPLTPWESGTQAAMSRPIAETPFNIVNAIGSWKVCLNQVAIKTRYIGMKTDSKIAIVR